jgi:hypothetical protein
VQDIIKRAEILAKEDGTTLILDEGKKMTAEEQPPPLP